MRCIKELSLEELKRWLKDNQEPAYRAEQIFHWLYSACVKGFDGMTNLSAPLREKLAGHFEMSPLRLSNKLVSFSDNTEKYLLELPDQRTIESVVMPYPRRCTICISTQVGCPVQCVFCATGRRGLKRNLSPDEIVSQYVFWANYLKKHRPGEKIGGVVYMGMGEPFLNYDSVAESLKVLTDPGLIGLGDRHISVSTVGHVPGIRRFAKDFPQVNLAVSLHTVDNDLRSRLVPLNDKYPLDQISKALKDYIYSTKRKVFIEYVMLAGVNDSPTQARKLSEWLKTVASIKYFTVNIIPYNSTAYDYRAPDKGRVEAFTNILTLTRVSSTVRKSLGADIVGACGQLADK